MSKSKKKSFVSILLTAMDVTFVGACLVVLYFLMSGIWEKFNSKATTKVISYRKTLNIDKIFPWITFCPLPAFKTKNVNFSEGNFLLNTFELEDIFLEEMVSILKNKSLYRLVQVNSTSYGRCYSVKPVQPTNAKWKSRFYLKRSIDQKVFLHQDGDERWLSVFDVPIDTKPITIEVGKRHHKFSLLSFKVYDSIALPNENRPCYNYESNVLFWNCFKQKFSTTLNVTCKIPGMECFYNTNSILLDYCKGEESIKKVFFTFFEQLTYFNGDTSAYGCEFPCHQREFIRSASYFHENIWLDTDWELIDLKEDYFMLGLHLEDIQVQEDIESLVYDWGNFLAQTGGNFSLILGFSCWSAYFSLMKYFRTRLFSF